MFVYNKDKKMRKKKSHKQHDDRDVTWSFAQKVYIVMMFHAQFAILTETAVPTYTLRYE